MQVYSTGQLYKILKNYHEKFAQRAKFEDLTVISIRSSKLGAKRATASVYLHTKSQRREVFSQRPFKAMD